MEAIELLDKRALTRYKSIVRKMLTSISKFGSSKEKDDIVKLYHFIDRNHIIHPVIFIYQDVNPWGSAFYPSKMFIVGSDFPADINIFKTKSNLSNYKVTLSAEINVSEFKKEIDSMKEISIIYTEEGCMLDFPVLSHTGDIDGYVDYMIIKSEDINQLVNSKNLQFNMISDEAELRNIHVKVSEDTQCSIIAASPKSKPLQMFYSIFPIKMDRFEYARRLKVYDNDVTSIVYCKQYIGNIIIHNFYKYVDIWNLFKKKGDK